jgi:hypothetical protein
MRSVCVCVWCSFSGQDGAKVPRGVRSNRWSEICGTRTTQRMMTYRACQVQLAEPRAMCVC